MMTRYPLRRGSPVGSNQSFEVEVRPVVDQVNHQPSLAILGEESENPEPEEDPNGSVHGNGSVVHERSDKKGRSVSIGDVKINGVTHFESSILASPTIQPSNQKNSMSPTKTTAINSVVTLVTQQESNGMDDRRASTMSAQNV